MLTMMPMILLGVVFVTAADTVPTPSQAVVPSVSSSDHQQQRHPFRSSDTTASAAVVVPDKADETEATPSLRHGFASTQLDLASGQVPTSAPPKPVPVAVGQQQQQQQHRQLLHPRCDLCHDGSYPQRPNQGAVVLQIPGDHTCGSLYTLGRNGGIPDNLCNPLQDYFDEPCGCFVNNAPTPVANPSDWTVTGPTGTTTIGTGGSPFQTPTSFGGGGGSSPTAGTSTGGFCFSDRTLVRTVSSPQPNKNGGRLVPIDTVKIGDAIQTGVGADGTDVYGTVISWNHWDATAVTWFVQLHLSTTTTTTTPKINDPEDVSSTMESSTKSVLEVSGHHMLFLADGTPVRAQDATVGTVLSSGSSTDAALTTTGVVTKVDTVQRRGLYAPVTDTGRILVGATTLSDDVADLSQSTSRPILVEASCYVAVLPNVTPRLQHEVGHAVHAPLRWMCGNSVNIDQEWCRQETYTAGVSNYVWSVLALALRLGRYSAWVQQLAVAVVTPLCVVVRGMESLLWQWWGGYSWMTTMLFSIVVGGGLRFVTSKNRTTPTCKTCDASHAHSKNS